MKKKQKKIWSSQVRLPHKLAMDVRIHSEQIGISVNQFIRFSCEEKIERLKQEKL